jgi:transcriptional regulator with XRE-family HTH domain
MESSSQLDFFFGNLLRLMNESGMSKRRLAIELGMQETALSEVLSRRTDPTLGVIYGIAGALKVDVADLLRPGPQIGISSGGSDNYWVERTAEEYLTNELAKSRERAAHEPPTFDAVLSWWHTNEGRLTRVDSFSRYIELFEPPDVDDLRPRPATIGAESLGSRELGHSDPDQLRRIFDSADPEVGRAVARAHLETAGGQPRLSVHTILINLASGSVVKLSYARLLLPVSDGNGHTYVMNYSKPIRRSEIGREQIDHLEPTHGREPVIARLV